MISLGCLRGETLEMHCDIARGLGLPSYPTEHHKHNTRICIYYVYVYIYIYMCVYTYVNKYIYIGIYIYICMYMYMYMYMYVCACVCVCVCICVYYFTKIKSTYTRAYSICKKNVYKFHQVSIFAYICKEVLACTTMFRMSCPKKVTHRHQHSATTSLTIPSRSPIVPMPRVSRKLLKAGLRPW